MWWAEGSQGKVKLNDVLQPVLEQGLIRRVKEMQEQLKADGLRICWGVVASLQYLHVVILWCLKPSHLFNTRNVVYLYIALLSIHVLLYCSCYESTSVTQHTFSCLPYSKWERSIISCVCSFTIFDSYPSTEAEVIVVPFRAVLHPTAGVSCGDDL